VQVCRIGEAGAIDMNPKVIIGLSRLRHRWLSQQNCRWNNRWDASRWWCSSPTCRWQLQDGTGVKVSKISLSYMIVYSFQKGEYVVLLNLVYVVSMMAKITFGNGGHLLTCRQDGTATKNRPCTHLEVPPRSGYQTGFLVVRALFQH
jgi:hypothetical protein